MKKFILIAIPLLLLLTGGILTFHFTHCETNENTAVAKKDSCCPTEMDAANHSENSLYNLESVWRDQNNNSFTLNELKGKSVIMTMFFASCSYACPILVNDMKKIESALTPEELKQYTFLLISIDHERDTPEVLKDFALRYDLDTSRWKLLHGDSEEILELAAVLGFKFKKEENGEYSHTNQITLLNFEGEIIHQHLGLNRDMAIASSIAKSL
jgi:protein SCO1